MQELYSRLKDKLTERFSTFKMQMLCLMWTLNRFVEFHKIPWWTGYFIYSS